jgi:hypothetical protein
MRSRFLNGCWNTLLALTILLVTSPGVRAEDQSGASQDDSNGLHTVRIVDVLNLFSNVGALIYFVEPNDLGIPTGIVTSCTGTLIHERVLLVAGHCTAPTAGGLLPFIKAFVTLSPTALDRSTWRPVSHLAFHPSTPPAPLPKGVRSRASIRAFLTSVSCSSSSQCGISRPRGSQRLGPSRRLGPRGT